MSLKVGTGKLHVKNPLEKSVGLREKSLRTFYVVVVFFVVVFALCFNFLTLILFSFLQFLTVERALEKSCSEDFYIHIQTKVLEKYLGDSFLVRFKASIW